MKPEPQNNNFDFIKSLSDYFTKFISRFKGHTTEDLNAAILEEGRTEEEKEQLQEMCEEVDNYHRRLKELRESGLTPGKWLDEEIDKELKKVDKEIEPGTSEEVKKLLTEQFIVDIENNCDALSDELDQTVEIAKKG